MDQLLLIDIGNTRVKLALSDGDTLGERRHLATAQLTSASLRAAVEDWPCRRAVLCSVVPQRDDAVRVVFGSNLLEVRHTTPMSIGIDYPNPASIGADRLANAVALKERYGCPGIAVDFGTAVTFDLVSARADYVGGVIAPGLEMMTDYLPERTALLPRIELAACPPIIGHSTVEAMQAGAYYGYVGMTRHILAKLAGELGMSDSAAIVATGGAAELLHPALPEVRHYDPDLTIQGLRLIARHNQF